jgi:acetyl esterase/lipase
MKLNSIWAIALLLGAGGPVCSQTPPGAIQIENSLTYGKGGETDLLLDLAVPASGTGPFPAIICIHGGGWRGGKRQDLSQTMKTIASRGFVAATISYRLVPTAKFPAPVEDCKAAVRWLRANAAKYKIDKDHIGVVGFSAGGHLASMLGLTGNADGFEGKGGSADQSSSVQAVVDFFGPADLASPDWSEDVRTRAITPFIGAALSNHAELYRKASPITYVKAGAAPFLIFHGTDDPTVPIQQSRGLAAKLRENGVSIKVIEVAGAKHGWGGDQMLKSMEETINFFNEQLRSKK